MLIMWHTFFDIIVCPLSWHLRANQKQDEIDESDTEKVENAEAAAEKAAEEEALKVCCIHSFNSHSAIY